MHTLIDEYEHAHFWHVCFHAAAKLATEDKDTALDALIDFMKVQLTQAEVDTAARPTAMDLIGYGPAAEGATVDPPGMPRAFETEHQGPGGELILDWKAPAAGDGGPVRTYVVERRDQPAEGGAFGRWRQIGASLTTEAHLHGQPQVVNMEYRVFGANIGGQGEYSTTLAVVL